MKRPADNPAQESLKQDIHCIHILVPLLVSALSITREEVSLYMFTIHGSELC